MGGVFSRKAKPPPPPAAPREVVLSPQEESMLQLKRQRDKVTKFGDRLFKEAEVRGCVCVLRFGRRVSWRRCLRVCNRPPHPRPQVCTRKAREAVAKNDRSAAERFIKMRMLKNKRREQVLAQLSNLESLVRDAPLQGPKACTLLRNVHVLERAQVSSFPSARACTAASQAPPQYRWLLSRQRRRPRLCFQPWRLETRC